MTEEFVLKRNGGLHARPAADFVKNCKGLSSDITLTCKGKTANAKSLISILSLGAGVDSTLCIEVTGDNAVHDIEIVRQSLQGLL